MWTWNLISIRSPNLLRRTIYFIIPMKTSNLRPIL